VAHTIFCDESGYTGPNLLDEQRFYVYASVAMPHDLACEVVAKLRTDFQINSKELKFENFSHSRGKAALRWLLTTCGDRTAIFYADKKFSAAGKFFEYTFEPVLRPMKDLFYGVGFHKFVSNLLLSAWDEGEPVARELIEDGQKLIRDKDPGALKRLLREPLHIPGGDDPLTAIASFGAAYRRGILREIAAITADEVTARWWMDISDTALLQVLEHWGQSGEEIEMICDESKPLQESAEHLTFLATTNISAELGFPVSPSRNPVRLAKPIRFVESKGEFVGVQLADVVAGATRSMLLKPKSRDAAELRSLIEPRLVPMCIYPEPHLLALHRPDAVVNCCILAELGRRSRAGLDPLAYMPQHVAKLQRGAPAIAAAEGE
jgi:hypothetical protein